MRGEVLANADSAERNESDFYPTPEDVTIALLECIGLPDYGMWECAAGDGAITKVLRTRGFRVIETDINGEPSIDFLMQRTMPDGANFIITNPPFRLASAFVSHALHIPNMLGCAFLLKSQFWHAASRLALFRKQPPSLVLPLTWRPDFCFGDRGGAPTMEVLWTVWFKTDRTTGTVYYPLERPGIQNQIGMNFEEDNG